MWALMEEESDFITQTIQDSWFNPLLLLHPQTLWHINDVDRITCAQHMTRNVACQALTTPPGFILIGDKNLIFVQILYTLQDKPFTTGWSFCLRIFYSHLPQIFLSMLPTIAWVAKDSVHIWNLLRACLRAVGNHQQMYMYI